MLNHLREKIFAAVILMTGIACSNYFNYSNYSEKWTTKELQRAHEQPLDRSDRGSEIYRMHVMLGCENPTKLYSALVRVEKTLSGGKIVLKTNWNKGKGEERKWYERSAMLNKEQWNAIADRIDTSRYWELRRREHNERLFFGGHGCKVEGYLKGDFHFVERITLTKNVKFIELCGIIWSIALTETLMPGEKQLYPDLFWTESDADLCRAPARKEKRASGERMRCSR